jgi:hypothetical protein
MRFFWCGKESGAFGWLPLSALIWVTRAMVAAVYRSEAVTVTTLMIVWARDR